MRDINSEKICTNSCWFFCVRSISCLTFSSMVSANKFWHLRWSMCVCVMVAFAHSALLIAKSIQIPICYHSHRACRLFIIITTTIHTNMCVWVCMEIWKRKESNIMFVLYVYFLHYFIHALAHFVIQLKFMAANIRLEIRIFVSSSIKRSMCVWAHASVSRNGER